jgi:serine/threonine protein kinase
MSSESGNTPTTTWTVQSTRSGTARAGRFRIGQKLSAGGFGATHPATDTQLNQRPWVDRQLKIDSAWNDHERATAKASFTHEAAMLISLNAPGRPNIPEMYACLEHDTCLVSKHIADQSLEVVMSQCSDRRLDVAEAADTIGYTPPSSGRAGLSRPQTSMRWR